MQKDQLTNRSPPHFINSELAIKNFFDSAPFLMGVADVENNDIRHVADNEATGDFFGMSPEAMSGRLASELGAAQSSITLWLDHYLKSKRDMKPVNFTYEHTMGKNKKFLLATVFYIGDNESGFSRYSYIVQDITNQLRSRELIEKQLLASEERFKSVVENMSEGLMMFDATGNLTYQNPASLQMHGTKPVEDKNISYDSLTATWEGWDEKGEKIADDQWPVAKVFRHEKIKNQIIYVRRVETGHEFYGSYNGCPIYDSNGKLALAFITIRDITEYVRAEEMVKENAERFRTIANSLPLIIWTSRPDGFVDWYNQWYFDYTGLPLGTNWDEESISPIHPDDLPGLIEEWSNAITTGTPTKIEFRIKRQSDGEYRWHLSRGVPVRNKEGKIIKWVGCNTDIHDQKILVEQLEKERELRDRFVTALTHDLRTPLTAAMINAQLMIRKADNPEIVHKSKAKIVDNLERVDSMIRDLLDANRIKAGEKLSIDLGHCNLNNLITEVLDDLSTVHGNRFKTILAGEINGYWSCTGIRRILENLCINAVKYGSPHSEITITANVDDDKAEIKVHNVGNPIAEAELQKVFQPFSRSESAAMSGHKGWGVGLSLVKGLTEAQGGNVQVSSSLEDGTTFFVQLPLKNKN